MSENQKNNNSKYLNFKDYFKEILMWPWIILMGFALTNAINNFRHALPFNLSNNVDKIFTLDTLLLSLVFVLFLMLWIRYTIGNLRMTDLTFLLNPKTEYNNRWSIISSVTILIIDAMFICFLSESLKNDINQILYFCIGYYVLCLIDAIRYLIISNFLNEDVLNIVKSIRIFWIILNFITFAIITFVAGIALFYKNKDVFTNNIFLLIVISIFIVASFFDFFPEKLRILYFPKTECELNGETTK